MDNYSTNIAILIISCDKYSDLWESSIKMFDKFWPDCSYDKYLLTNLKKPEYYGFQVLNIGEDKTWSYGLKEGLKILQNKYTYVFTMVEDYFFIETINNHHINDMFSSIIEKQYDFLSLFKLPSNLFNEHKHYGRLENNIPYRHSVGFTLWKIKTLLDILVDAENAWEFEKYGVVRSFNYPNFYGSYYNYKVCNLVIKGKLEPFEYIKFRNIFPDIHIDRPIMSKFEIYLEKTRSFIISLFLNFLPNKIKNRIYFSDIPKFFDN